MTDPEDRWSGGKRSDGLAIVEGLDGLVIMPAEAGLPLDRCPCCDKPFRSDDRGMRGARLVADFCYPFRYPLATNNAGR